MYANIHELPVTIRDVLPPSAQELYLRVYNEILEADMPETTQTLSRESMAHQLAWDAVTREFVHDARTKQWYRKGEAPTEEAIAHKGILERIKDLF